MLEDEKSLKRANAVVFMSNMSASSTSREKICALTCCVATFLASYFNSSSTLQSCNLANM